MQPQALGGPFLQRDCWWHPQGQSRGGSDPGLGPVALRPERDGRVVLCELQFRHNVAGASQSTVQPKWECHGHTESAVPQGEPMDCCAGELYWLSGSKTDQPARVDPECWDAERRSRGWFHRLGALEMLWLILRLHSHCGPLTLGRGRPGVTVDGQGSGPDDWTGWATVLRQDERIGLRRGASCLRVTRPY